MAIDAVWLKLGDVGHVLVGICMTLAAIVQALSRPHRLGYGMQRAQE